MDGCAVVQKRVVSVEVRRVFDGVKGCFARFGRGCFQRTNEATAGAIA